MRKRGIMSVTDEELNSSPGMQDWNQQTYAREIYENIGEILCLAKIRIASLNPDREEEARKIVKQADQLLAKAIQDLRNLARQIIPEKIMHQGIAAAIDHELKRLNVAGVCTTNCSVKGSVYKMDGLRELILFSVLNHYIYLACYEDKAVKMSVDISYHLKNVSFKIAWQPEAVGASNEHVREKDDDLRRRAGLIHAQIRHGDDDTGKRVYILVKRTAT